MNNKTFMHLTRNDNYILNKNGFVLWFTGLSGSGKSTLAAKIKKYLFGRKKLVYWIDGDVIRKGLNDDLGFDENDRKENIRRIAHIVKLFKDIGFVVIVSTISPHIEMREYARNLIGKKNFVEIYVKTSITTCQKRDPKGYYKNARNGNLKQFTGISSIYEKPMNPNLIIDAEKKSLENCLDDIIHYVNNKFYKK